jgi:hypothetical protein
MSWADRHYGAILAKPSPVTSLLASQLVDKVCRACGEVFLGARGAKDCPGCRPARVARQNARANERLRARRAS